MTLVDILQARRRISPYVRRTPLVESAWLSSVTAGRVSLKLESLQVASSFKSRGAFNAVLARRERGQDVTTELVTASAGNHGRALAAAAQTFGLRLVVFTPLDAPRAKLDAIRRHGATLRAEGRDYDEAERMAKAFAAETGAPFVSPYNDPDVIAGAGTIGPELLEDVPELDAVLVPIGGGGLIGGVAAAVKHIHPSCRVVGVEAAVSCPFQTSIKAGRLVEIVPGTSLADGLTGNPDRETITLPLVQKHVDEIVTVTEDEIAAAIAGLVEFEHLIAEGAGAVGVAALLAGKVRSARIATILTGSNIDRTRLATLIAV